MILSTLTVKALSGTGFSPESHPALIDLLELAHAPPFAPTRAERMALTRQNQTIRELIRLAGLAKLEDQHLLKLAPFRDLEWQEGRWLFTGQDDLDRRKAVRAALQRVLASLEGHLRPFQFDDLRGLKLARKANGLPEIEQEIGPAKVMSPLLQGNRFVASILLFRVKFYLLVQANELGQLMTLVFGNRPRFVMDWHKKNPAK